MVKKTPLKAIRAYCIGCSGFSYKEVRYCPSDDCPLYGYRFGKRAARTNDPDLSETNLKEE